MERFPYIPNSEISFAAVKESNNSIAPKNCPMCNTELGTLGIIRAARKTCYYCKQIFCKKCAYRKISSNSRRACEACYKNSLRYYFKQQIIQSQEKKLKTLLLDIQEKKKKISDLSQQISNNKTILSEEKKLQSTNSSEEKHKLLPLLKKVQQAKDLCNKARAKIQPLEAELNSSDKVFEELNREIYSMEKENLAKSEELNCLKQNLATAQDLNESLLNEFRNRAIQCSHSDQGIEVNSVSDLRKLRIIKKEDFHNLTEEKIRLEKELARLDSEILMFEAHKSCRFSGVFNNYIQN